MEEAVPLLVSLASGKAKKTRTQKAVRKTLKGTAQLAKLLPTGTVLAFQILSPAVTQQGTCPTGPTRTLTGAMLASCAASCFVLSFTDSVRDPRGKVRYGIATPGGLCLLDAGPVRVEAPLEGFRLRPMDWARALASVLVFAAVAAFDPNVVRCFVPEPSKETKELLMALPVIVGLLCSLFFVAFPSPRHGIGFPLSPN